MSQIETIVSNVQAAAREASRASEALGAAKAHHAQALRRLDRAQSIAEDLLTQMALGNFPSESALFR